MGGYYIPEELQNKEEDLFLFSFIKRTKLNLELIEKAAIVESELGKKTRECTAFETTQLINSLMGLLVFPMESFLNKTIKDFSRDNSVDKVIKSIKKDNEKYEYYNTYRRYDNTTKKYIDKYERLTRYKLIKHMRDAMCHENLAIKPIPSENDDIRWITFADYYPSKDDPLCEFFVKLSVEEVRNIALALCDEFLDVALNTYHIDFKENN